VQWDRSRFHAHTIRQVVVGLLAVEVLVVVKVVVGVVVVVGLVVEVLVVVGVVVGVVVDVGVVVELLVVVGVVVVVVVDVGVAVELLVVVGIVVGVVVDVGVVVELLVVVGVVVGVVVVLAVVEHMPANTRFKTAIVDIKEDVGNCKAVIKQVSTLYLIVYQNIACIILDVSDLRRWSCITIVCRVCSVSVYLNLIALPYVLYHCLPS